MTMLVMLMLISKWGEELQKPSDKYLGHNNLDIIVSEEGATGNYEQQQAQPSREN